MYKDAPDYTDLSMSPIFADLNIDVIINNIADNAEKPYLKEYYVQKPRNEDDLHYRLAVMEDLMKLRDDVIVFVQKFGMYKRYDTYSKTLSQKEVRQKWHLDGAQAYCESLFVLESALKDAVSEGLLQFRQSLIEYLRSDAFVSLYDDVQECTARLGGISFGLNVGLADNLLVVDEGGGEVDCIEDFHKVFSRYKCDAWNSGIHAFADLNMSSLELEILEHLKRMYPDAFASLRSFYDAHSIYNDALFDDFERELHFYLSYIDYMDNIQKKGYAFTFPRFTQEKEIKLIGGYGLELAQEGMTVIPNDFYMDVTDKHFILTGPNQGGKTTFSRMLGQNLYFSHMGLPVPCVSLETCFFDGLYTHFIKEEELNNLGRLKEELNRLKPLIDAKPRNGFVIINELFSSAALYDAIRMGGDILKRLGDNGCTCLYVTHIFELADSGPCIASLVAGMDEGMRTYKISRRQPEGMAYANHLLDKYCLYKKDIEVRLDDSFNTV